MRIACFLCLMMLCTPLMYAQLWPNPPILLSVEGRPQRADYLGYGLLAVDANGDEYTDIAVSSLGRRKTLFYFGGPGILDGEADAIIEGGGPMVGADFNGDGLMDIAMHRPGRTIDSLTGEGHGLGIPDSVYIYFARRRDGFMYEPTPGLRFGVHERWSIASAFGLSMSTGDVNRDGYTDLVASAPSFQTAPPTCRQGKVTVYFGSPSRPLADQFEIYPDSNGCDNTFGAAVSVCDVNADGIDDIVIGVNKRADMSPQNGRTSKQVYLGVKGFDTASIVSYQCLEGQLLNDPNTWFHYMPVLDINGDGAADIMYQQGHGMGILLGSDSGYSYANTRTIGNPDGEAMRWFGGEIFNLGDWNADGWDDYAISFYGYASRWIGIFAGGSGGIKDTMLTRTVKTRDLEYYGRFVISGDFNGDGIGDYCSSKVADYEGGKYPIQPGWFHIVSGMPKLTVDVDAVTDRTDGVDLEIEVAPNPTQGETSVRVRGIQPGPLEIDVLDRQGVVVSSLPAGQEHSTERSWSLDLCSLKFSSGVYFVRVRNARRERVEKVILLLQ